MSNVFKKKDSESTNTNCIAYEEYLDRISPKQVESKVQKQPSNTSEEPLVHGLTLNEMEGCLELKDKVLGILANAHIVSSDFISQVLSLPMSLELISALELVSFCIRGNWILKRYGFSLFLN